MRLDSVYFLKKEKLQDMIQAAEQERLLQQAELQTPGQTGLHPTLIVWVGTQMVRWGARLQKYSFMSGDRESQPPPS